MYIIWGRGAIAAWTHYGAFSPAGSYFFDSHFRTPAGARDFADGHCPDADEGWLATPEVAA